MTLEKAACEYFLLVSRLEYALKNGGFCKSGQDDAASPDWEKFIRDVSLDIDNLSKDEDIKYFLNNPPKKQLYKDNELSYSPPQNISDTDKQGMLQACLTIRNNIFHGAKHSDSSEQRNNRLISAATKILKAASESEDKVKQAFDNAKL